VRPAGSDKLGTRCEIKNLNSFRFLERAIEFEAKRQVEILEDGGRIEQETRLYDADMDETRSMRTKEEAHDYRYFPDPDLLPLEVSESWIGKIKLEMPELPRARRERYVSEYSLPDYDAAALTSSKEMAEYFEKTTRLTVEMTRILIAPAGGQPVLGGIAKLASNWIKGDLAGRLNADNLDFNACPIPPAKLARLLARILSGDLSGKLAKEVLAAMWSGEDGGDPDSIIKKRSLIQISSSAAL
jgi:aspartyl-tRNA(Asn)/glutamyl-tRNA(Gln) amidotransferase subunit B